MRIDMTLFGEVAEDAGVFWISLRNYFDKTPDPVTLEILDMENPV